MIRIPLKDLIEAAQEPNGFSDAELTQTRLSDVVKIDAPAEPAQDGEDTAPRALQRRNRGHIPPKA